MSIKFSNMHEGVGGGIWKEGGWGMVFSFGNSFCVSIVKPP